MKKFLFGAALAMLAACGNVPDPDPNGRIPGHITDGGVEGCPQGWEGRSLPGLTVAFCCPPGSTSATCPRLAPTECTGAWPGIVCPGAPQVGRGCGTDGSCPEGLTCSDATAPGERFCTRPCSPDRDGGSDDCGILGGVCERSNSDAGASWICLPRCVLPMTGASGERNPLAASCAIGICAQLTGEAPDSRRGVCYPGRP